MLGFGVGWREELGKPECPYVIRWRLSTPLGSLRVHHWLGSDDDRALHDHPWRFVTLVLKGGYEDLGEHSCKTKPQTDGDGFIYCPECGCSVTSEQPGRFTRGQYTVDKLTRGSIRYRSAFHKHTVQVCPEGAWTLLLTGRRTRDWGFWVDGRWRKRNRYFWDHGEAPCEDRRRA